MYTPRRTELQFKMLFEEDPVPIASSQQYHIYSIQIFIYVLLRERSRKMCSKTYQLTINKKSGEYAVCSNTPKYSVRSNTLSIIFV